MLYPLAYEHIDSYLAHYSAQVQKILHVDDLAQERRYIEQCVRDNNSFFYVMAQKAHAHTIMGGIEIRSPSYRSQLYCWMHEDYWGKGYFQEAMELVASYYFKISGQASICACVDYHNERSFYALKKIGFQEKKITVGPYGLQYELVLRNRG